MNSSVPPNPEGPSLPQRLHRPTKDTLATDTTEKGFWDLDDLGADDPATPARSKIEPRRSIPASPERETAAPERETAAPERETAAPESEIAPPESETAAPEEPATSAPAPVPILPSKNNISRRMTSVERFRSSRDGKDAQAATAPETPPPAIRGAPLEATFAELEAWDVPAPAPPKAPAKAVFEGIPEHADFNPEEESTDSSSLISLTPSRPPAAEAPAARPSPAKPAAATNPDSEFAPTVNPDAKPFSLRPHLKLTLLETIGMVCLVLALLAGGAWVYQNTLGRIGQTDASHGKIEYPVRGKHVTITKLVSYWRAPVTTVGIRRGVVLVPVVEVTVSGGPGAIRVLFNDTNGKKAGDPEIRAVNGETTLTIAATDGFEDVSMHAAYRIDLTKSWDLRIAEAPAENSPGAEFKELLKTPISPEIKETKR
jgi:hypothetical protein